jgi:streptogramin lyase
MHRKHFGRLGYPKPTLEHLEDRRLLTGGITELPFPSGFGQPFDIAAGPDGNLWFTQETTGTDTISSDHIGRITPDGSVTEFPVPAVGTIVPLDGAGLHIAAGRDGNLWYTEIGVDKIARLSPSGDVTEFPIPTTGGNPGSITAGPDGSLWFTEDVQSLPPASFRLGNIGRITTSGVVTEFPIATPNSTPSGIARGSDGNLWFTENLANKVARITPGGVITEFTIPTADSGPTAITTGGDGNLWFVEGLANRIGQITPNGSITEFPVPTVNSHPYAITAGPDGNLWFTESIANKIGQIFLSGRITEFPIPTANSFPAGITAGPDGNIWFTEETAGGIGPRGGTRQLGKFVLNGTGTPDARFVSQVYLDLLHRPAEPIGLAFWSSALSQGALRADIVQGIEGSPEYRTVVVQDLYTRFLHRSVDPSGMTAFTTFLATGGTVEQVETALTGSAEYFRVQGGGTNDGFLDALYRDALNRTVDLSGRSSLDQALNHGVPLAQVGAAVIGSDEFRQDLVQSFYQRFLRRQGETAGLQGWTGVLRAGARDEQVIAEIVGSSEYFVPLEAGAVLQETIQQ